MHRAATHSQTRQTSLSLVQVSPKENGCVAYAADGAYANRVHLWAVCFVAYTLARAAPAAGIPVTLAHDLAAINATYVRHATAEQRCLYVLRETAIASKENRALDPFMMVGLLQKTHNMRGDQQAQ